MVVRSSNYTLYGDMSSRVMEVLSRFTPDLEIYSIDEAFIGMDGLARGWKRRRGRCARPYCNGPASRCRSALHRPRRWPRSPIDLRKRTRNDRGSCCCLTKRRRMPLWRDGYRYKKAGVMLLDLHPAAAVQAGLFDQPDSETA